VQFNGKVSYALRFVELYSGIFLKIKLVIVTLSSNYEPIPDACKQNVMIF
jgi:hypothetical protein